MEDESSKPTKRRNDDLIQRIKDAGLVDVSWPVDGLTPIRRSP